MNVTNYFLSQVLLSSAAGPILANMWSYYGFNASLSADATGNGHTLTLHGSPSQGPGPVANAIVLNGSTKYAEVTDSFPWQNPFSVFGWFKCTSVNSGVILADTAVANGIDFQAAGSGTVNFFTNSLTLTVGPHAVAANVWTHFAMTWDGSTLVGYLKGLPVGSISGSPSVSAAPVWLGTFQGSSGLFGSLAEIGFATAPLSPQSIALLAQGLVYPFAGI
jgi:hypothetical protein